MTNFKSKFSAVVVATSLVLISTASIVAAAPCYPH
jgi:hypothetical protein